MKKKIQKNKNVIIQCSVKYLRKAWGLISLLLSMAGYVPEHASNLRSIAMLLALALASYLAFFHPTNLVIAVMYYLISEFMYIGFIFMVLRKDGYRRWFIKKWGPKKGYIVYEGVLGFLFFNNAASIGFVASSTQGNLFDMITRPVLIAIAAILFVTGFVIKVWAAKVTSIDIYYWKDMFLGKKISKFVVTGPYKYFSNPMYGIGQLQAYAVAIYNGSKWGLITAILNQCLIFLFYHKVEKKFINRFHKHSK